MLGLELIELLNESGTYAGVIMDKEIAHDKNILHNEISVFVVNDKNEVLLQKRSPNKRFKPDKWGLCSGHVDAFESLEQAAIREVYEEIGLKIKEKDLHPFYGRKIFKNEQNSHISYFYYAESNLKEEDFIIQEEELTEVKWVPIEEIKCWIDEGKTSFSKESLEEFEILKEELARNNINN